VDLLSFSAHKFHGPKGIGGLYIRPGFELEPIILGGGQERGLRSGTTNTPALAGLAAAAGESIKLPNQKTEDLRDIFEYRLKQELPDTIIHSRVVSRLPNTSYFSLPGLVGEEVADALAAVGIIVGTGAACSSGAIRYSKTLSAMGVSHELVVGALRVSLSNESSLEDITNAIVELKAIKERYQLCRKD
jgi:cysteine desulfurase